MFASTPSLWACLLLLSQSPAVAPGTGPATVSEAPPSREILKAIAAEPRLAGTTGSLWGAKLVAKYLEDAGWEVLIEPRVVLLSLPRKIEIVARGASDAKETLFERRTRFDPDAIPAGDLPLCNAWSASGTSSGEVVDVGRGLRADFEALAKAGVDVKGKIALARYGGAYRGVKVDLATQFGCIGILLFNDPAQDGTDKGDAWPKGPWKPGNDAERGSISPMGRAPGDPSTPGWASPMPGEKDRRRLSGKELDDALPKIPCVPLGSADAKALIENLAKRSITNAKGEPEERAIGPGPAHIEMTVDMPRDLRTIHNVIAKMPGEDGQFVMAGGHRDSWVRGANDNGAGMTVLIRTAQELSKKRAAGWKPRHGILLGFWDAEEFGLIGSTEWGEAHNTWVHRRVLAYVNCDAGVSGRRFSGASGSPGMLGPLRGVLERSAPAPNVDGSSVEAQSLWEEWVANAKDKTPKLGLPGSGSDFAVFVHHLQVPVLEFSFGGNSGGQYHTMFDDFSMIERYLDPGFVGHETAARLMTEYLATIADRKLTPIDAAEATRDIVARARELGTSLAKDAGSSSAQAILTECERLATSLEKVLSTWDAENPPRIPGYGWNPSGTAVREPNAFYEHTNHFDVVRGDVPCPYWGLFDVEDGIANRAWFKNPLWAPGLESGYGSETFPDLRSAAKQGPAALAKAIDALLKSLPISLEKR